VICEGEPLPIVLFHGLCLCCSVIFSYLFISQSVYYVFTETVVVSHIEYFLPFLFCSLYHDRHSEHSVDVVVKGCDFMIVQVIGG